MRRRDLVGLLPELHVDGGVQLDEPRVQVHLLGLGVVQVDRVGVGVGVLDDQVQVVPELVAELPELCLALVLQAELEGLLRDVVVETLNPGGDEDDDDEGEGGDEDDEDDEDEGEEAGDDDGLTWSWS